MDKMDFIRQILRLQDVYGEDKYPDPCVHEMYKEFNHLPAAKFERAIDRVLAQYPNPRSTPGVVEIEKIIAQLRDEYQEAKVRQNQSKGPSVSTEHISKAMGDLRKELEQGGNSERIETETGN